MGQNEQSEKGEETSLNRPPFLDLALKPCNFYLFLTELNKNKKWSLKILNKNQTNEPNPILNLWFRERNYFKWLLRTMIWLSQAQKTMTN